MAVHFSEGKKFLLNDKELYDGAYITKVEFFHRGQYDLYEVTCEIFDKIKCFDGKKDEEGKVIDTSLGKKIKCTLWLNEDGMFSSKDKNAIQIWAEAKGLSVSDDDFKISDIEGAVFRLGVVNTDSDGKTYSNIDKSKIFAPKEGTLETYKQYMEYKKSKEKESTEAVTGNSEKKTRPKFGDDEPKKEEKKIDETKDTKRNPFMD